MDLVEFGKIEVFGHGEPTPLVAPAFSGGFQTELPLPGGWVPRGRTLQSFRTQPGP